MGLGAYDRAGSRSGDGEVGGGEGWRWRGRDGAARVCNLLVLDGVSTSQFLDIDGQFILKDKSPNNGLKRPTLGHKDHNNIHQHIDCV